jgi:hypothetical protein
MIEAPMIGVIVVPQSYARKNIQHPTSAVVTLGTN